MEDITKRINENSTLICHMNLEWIVRPSICSTRVKNNPDTIKQHLINNHGWKSIPELVQRDIEAKKTTKADYKKLLREKPEEWFIDNQMIWSDFRNMHFLKPNGREFPKVTI